MRGVLLSYRPNSAHFERNYSTSLHLSRLIRCIIMVEPTRFNLIIKTTMFKASTIFILGGIIELAGGQEQSGHSRL